VKSSLVRQALILVALALLPGIGEAIYFRDKVSWQSPIPASEMVTLAQARAWGRNAIWVDARPDVEFEREHIPGAVLLNEDRWNDLLPSFLEKWSPEKKVVVYCSSQSCNTSREVAHRLRNQAQPPMQNVFVLEGGWEEWLKSRK
jgi:rhodanese-related sulfurtransferase